MSTPTRKCSTTGCNEICLKQRTKCKGCCSKLQQAQNKSRYAKKRCHEQQSSICSDCGTNRAEPDRRKCSKCRKKKPSENERVVNYIDKLGHTRVGVYGPYYAEYLLRSQYCRLLSFNAFEEASKVLKDIPGNVRIDAKQELYIVVDESDSRSNNAMNSLRPEFLETLKKDLETIIEPSIKGKIREDFQDNRILSCHSRAIIYEKSSEYPQMTHMDTDSDEYMVIVLLSAGKQPEETHPCTLIIPHEKTEEEYKYSVERAAKFVLGSHRNSQLRGWRDIAYFRHFLQPREEIMKSVVSCNSEEKWSVGTVSIMKGGVVHCAPAHDSPRIVLFLVFSPTNASSWYQSEHQITPWTAISDHMLYKAQGEDEKILREAHTRVMSDWGKDPRSKTHLSYLQDLQNMKN